MIWHGRTKTASRGLPARCGSLRFKAWADCKNSTVKVIIKLAVRSSLPYGKLARRNVAGGRKNGYINDGAARPSATSLAMSDKF